MCQDLDVAQPDRPRRAFQRVCAPERLFERRARRSRPGQHFPYPLQVLALLGPEDRQQPLVGTVQR
jgi:hypothetical protein